jgi:DNA-binding MarR family transcriptional regulator
MVSIELNRSLFPKTTERKVRTVDTQLTGSIQEIQFIWELVRSGELTQKQLEQRIGASRSWISKQRERIQGYGFIEIEVKRSPLSPNYSVIHYRVTNRRAARAYARQLTRVFCGQYFLDEPVMTRLLEAGRLSERESQDISAAIDRVLAARRR